MLRQNSKTSTFRKKAADVSTNQFNPLSANSQNGQTHSNNMSVVADKLFECLTIFWGWGLKG